MSKVNLIDQLRKRGSGGGSVSASPRSYQRDPDVEFEDSGSGDSSSLDAYEKRRVVMLLLGIMLVLGGRKLVPLYTEEPETLARQEGAQISQQIAAEQQKSQGMKTIQDEMRQYDSRVADLKAKLLKVQQLDENRNLLVRMTDYIVKEMPQRLWFDRLDLDTRSRVQVSGYSSNYQIVSDFIKKLDGAIYFPQWRLLQTENRGSSESATTSNSTNSNVIQVPPESKRFELEAEVARI